MTLPPPSTVLDILYCIAIPMWLMDVYQHFVHRGIPNMRTAPAIRRKIIEILKADKAARGLDTYTIVDLGSGNGLLTREIARALPDARVVGIEIAANSVWWANLMKTRSGLKNLEYRRMSFHDFDFAEADAVVAFLYQAALGPLGKKMLAEARPGMLFAANRWTLTNGWVPESMRVPTLYLNQRSLHIYRAP
jgi:trans-aconitate methyltransferase